MYTISMHVFFFGYMRISVIFHNLFMNRYVALPAKMGVWSMSHVLQS